MTHVRPSSSAVDIANQALVLLGAKAITSFTDGDTNADTMARLYEQTKHELFRAYPWNFATKRARLAKLSPDPITTDFKFQYALPDDYIRVLRLWSPSAGSGVIQGSDAGYGRYRSSNYDIHYSVEGKSVLTDVDPCYVIYIADVDESQFMFQFTDAFIHRLAAKAAYGITGSNTRVNTLREDAAASLDEARTTDALEGSTEPLQSTRFTEVRL